MASGSPWAAAGGVALPPVDLAYLPTIPITADGMSIEELVLLPLTTAGRGGPGGGAASPRSERLLLSPRTAEACLMEGLEPDELRPKPPELFATDRALPDIVHMVRGSGYS